MKGLMVKTDPHFGKHHVNTAYFHELNSVTSLFHKSKEFLIIIIKIIIIISVPIQQVILLCRIMSYIYFTY